MNGFTIASGFCSAAVTKALGTGKTVAFSTLLTAVSLLGFALSGSFTLLLILTIPLGFGAGCVDAALNSFAAVHFKARHMNWLHSFWGIGVGVSPLIMSASLYTGWGWRGGYALAGILQVSVVIILFAALSHWKSAEREKREENPASIGTFKALGIKGVVYMITAFFFYCSLEGTVALWFSSYLVHSRQVAATAAASYLSLFFAGITLGRVLSGILSLRLGNVMLIRIGEIVILCGGILLFIPSGINITLAAILLVGLGCAPIYPSLIHETPAIFGDNAARGVIGLEMGFAYIGFTVVPALFGSLAEILTTGALSYVILILALFTIFFSERVFRIKQKI
jgi:fucose permease